MKSNSWLRDNESELLESKKKGEGAIESKMLKML